VATPVTAAMRAPRSLGRALERGEEVGEMVGLIIRRAGRLERVDEAARHDEHGEAAGHDQRDRGGLALEAGEVAEELAVEVGEHGY
jgi:hypothetical protein